MYSESFVSKKLKSFAQSNDWLISGEFIYGEEHGYLFTGIDGKKEKIFITPVPGISDDQKNDLFEILEKDKNTMQLDSYEIIDDFLSIRIKDSSSLKVSSIDFILAILVGALEEVSIVAQNRCQECKKLDANDTNFMYDLYCYMHSDCAKLYEDSTDSDVSQAPVDVIDENSSLPSSTLKTIGLTALGAFIGSIPWLLLPYIMDFTNDIISKFTDSTLAINFMQSLLTCICAYLVIYFAIMGFSLSKSKFDKKGRLIVGVTAGIFVILIQFIYMGILVIKEPGVALNIENYILNMQKYDFYITMIIGGVIGLVFVFINVLPFFDNKKNRKK